MAMEKKTAIILVVVLLLLILTISILSGKAVGLPCGTWGTAIHPDAKYKDCTCIGLKTRDVLTGGGSISCLGIPTSYSCYSYSSPGQKASIPCK